MRTIIYKTNGNNLRGLNSDELNAYYNRGIYVCTCIKTVRLLNNDEKAIGNFDSDTHYLYSYTRKNNKDYCLVYSNRDKNGYVLSRKMFEKYFIKTGLMEEPKKRKYTY